MGFLQSSTANAAIRDQLVAGSWLGRRLAWTGPAGPVAGLVTTQRRRRDGRYQLGVLLAQGTVVMVEVAGEPSLENATAEIAVDPGNPPEADQALGRADARALAEAVLAGRAQRAPVETVLRAMALAILNHVKTETV